MTTKPTLGSNKAVGNTLGAAEWNTNVLQQGNWTQEVVAGTNADKIASAALAVPVTTPQGNTSGFTPGTYSRLFEVSNGQLALAWNATYNGATWNRINTSLPAYLQQFGDLVNMEFYQAAAGANPITWTIVQTIATTGKLTGAGFYDSANFTIAGGATGTLTHGLGAKARFVIGYHDNASGSPTLVDMPIAGFDAPAGARRFTSCGAATIAVLNGGGSTIIARVFAML